MSQQPNNSAYGAPPVYQSPVGYPSPSQQYQQPNYVPQNQSPYVVHQQQPTSSPQLGYPAQPQQGYPAQPQQAYAPQPPQNYGSAQPSIVTCSSCRKNAASTKCSQCGTPLCLNCGDQWNTTANNGTLLANHTYCIDCSDAKTEFQAAYGFGSMLAVTIISMFCCMCCITLPCWLLVACAGKTPKVKKYSKFVFVGIIIAYGILAGIIIALYVTQII